MKIHCTTDIIHTRGTESFDTFQSRTFSLVIRLKSSQSQPGRLGAFGFLNRGKDASSITGINAFGERK